MLFYFKMNKFKQDNIKFDHAKFIRTPNHRNLHSKMKYNGIF